VDWPSFAAGVGAAAGVLSVASACFYVLEQRARLRQAFSLIESPSGKKTRRLKAVEVDELTGDPSARDTSPDPRAK
jgi:hypothetical protein